MNEQELLNLLERVRDGGMSPETAAKPAFSMASSARWVNFSLLFMYLPPNRSCVLSPFDRAKSGERTRSSGKLLP